MEPRLDMNMEALSRYLTGIASPEEQTDIDRWIENRPERRHWIESLRSSVVLPAQPVLDIQALNAKIRLAIDETTKPAITPSLQTGQERRPWQNVRPRMVLIATALPVLAILVWFTTSLGKTDTVGRGEQTYTYTTARGQMTTVFLGDGTHALMAPGSRLTYSDNGEIRQVTLSGSAHFTVSQAGGAKPFSVRTAQAVTNVLGTEFTVNAYADELDETVLVRSGRVSVRSSTQSKAQAVVVAAGQQARIDVARMTAITSASTDAFSWIDGTLRFSNSRVSDVIREIGRWYDLDIRVDDPTITSMHLNASFRRKSAEQVIQYLSVVLGVSVQWEGRVVTFHRDVSQQP